MRREPLHAVLLPALAALVFGPVNASPGSDDDVETSRSGAPVLRHQDPGPDPAPPTEHARNLEDIEAHVEKHIGPIERIIHEHTSDHVHIDIIVVAPTAERPYAGLGRDQQEQ